MWTSLEKTRSRRRKSSTPLYKNTAVLARGIIVLLGLLIVMGVMAAG